MATDYFIKGSIKHPGRTHRYLMKEYGEKAFKENGTIKQEYLDRAIGTAKANGETSLERALLEAKTLKKIVNR